MAPKLPRPYVEDETWDIALRIDVTRARMSVAELQGMLSSLDTLLQQTPYSGAGSDEAQQWVYIADRLFTPGAGLDEVGMSDLQKQQANLDADLLDVIEAVRRASGLKRPRMRGEHTFGKSPKPVVLRAEEKPRKPFGRKWGPSGE